MIINLIKYTFIKAKLKKSDEQTNIDKYIEVVDKKRLQKILSKQRIVFI